MNFFLPRRNSEITVISPEGSFGYDYHLFVKNLGKTSGEIRAIANNEQKYISFSKKVVVGNYFDEKGKEKLIHHEIRFVDSYKFMSFPLAESFPGALCFHKKSFW